MEQNKKEYKNLSESGDLNNSTNKTFFLPDKVIECKSKISYTPFDVVKILLRERAMKQVDLANKIGISRQALHNYLKNVWSAPTQIKMKIAVALGVDSAVIWDLEAGKW